MRKTIFSFSRRPKQMVFPKILRWNMIFLILLGNMIFHFLKNMILPLRRKMKDNLFQKSTRKYDIFFKLSGKMALPKEAEPAYDLCCIIWKDGIFFPENMIFFHCAESERQPFPGNTWKYDILCVHTRMVQT